MKFRRLKCVGCLFWRSPAFCFHSASCWWSIYFCFCERPEKLVSSGLVSLQRVQCVGADFRSVAEETRAVAVVLSSRVTVLQLFIDWRHLINVTRSISGREVDNLLEEPGWHRGSTHMHIYILLMWEWLFDVCVYFLGCCHIVWVSQGPSLECNINKAPLLESQCHLCNVPERTSLV